MEKIRNNPAARASSPTDKDEWTITEDGFRFGVGDRVFNYYDCVWVTVTEDPAETYNGWFDCVTDAGGRDHVNSVRVSAQPPAWYTGDK